MSQLRKCQSMNLGCRHGPSSFAGLQTYPRRGPIAPTDSRGSRSMPTRPVNLYTDDVVGSTGLYQVNEPISPLFLDIQDGDIGLTHSETLSTCESPLGLGPADKYNLTGFPIPKMDDESFRHEDAAEAFAGSKEPQHREDQVLDDKFTKSSLLIRLTNTIQLAIRDQQRISSMRIQLGEMRSRLNENRTRQVSQWADAAKQLKLMLTNTNLENSSPTSITTQLHMLENINQYSDDYLKQEIEYQDFQRQLETEEHYLQRRETKLAELLQQFSWNTQTRDSDARSADSRKASDTHRGTPRTWTLADDNSDYTTTSIGSHKDMDPLVEKYLSQLGDVRIYRERLDDLSLEHAAVTARQASRALVNMPLDKESQEFLSNYEMESLRIQQTLADKIKTANLLRRQCERAGLSLPEDIVVGLTGQLEFGIEKGLPLNRDLLWLSELDASQREPFFDLAKSGNFDAYHFINLWILHQLRHSTSFIHRFKANPRIRGLGIDEDTLSQWVLELWFEDASPRITSTLQTASGDD